MRKLLVDRGYKIFYDNLGTKIFNLWFNRWTTPLGISKAYYKSTRTHGGDLGQYSEAIKQLGFLDSKTNQFPLSCSIKSLKGEKKVIWIKSKKKLGSFRLNLNPYFEYLEKEKDLKLTEFDRYIIDLMFSMDDIREKVLKLNKNYFDSITEGIFYWLRLPLGEIKSELLDNWPTDERRINEYLKYLARVRETMNYKEFRGIKKKVYAGEILIPGELSGKSKYNKIYQLIYFLPNRFIKKIVKASIPQTLYLSWQRQHYNHY